MYTHIHMYMCMCLHFHVGLYIYMDMSGLGTCCYMYASMYVGMYVCMYVQRERELDFNVYIIYNSRQRSAA